MSFVLLSLHAYKCNNSVFSLANTTSISNLNYLCLSAYILGVNTCMCGVVMCVCVILCVCIYVVCVVYLCAYGVHGDMHTYAVGARAQSICLGTPFYQGSLTESEIHQWLPHWSLGTHKGHLPGDLTDLHQHLWFSLRCWGSQLNGKQSPQPRPDSLNHF